MEPEPRGFIGGRDLPDPVAVHQEQPETQGGHLCDASSVLRRDEELMVQIEGREARRDLPPGVVDADERAVPLQQAE